MSGTILTGAGLSLVEPEARSVIDSRDFALAVCRHLGLNPNHVSADDFTVTTGLNEIFGVRLHIALTAEDLAAIAKRMTT